MFDLLFERYHIKKKIKLIELFAGIGSQFLALKYLKRDGYSIDVESHRICEWAVKSIQAYKDLHFFSDNTDYSKDLNRDEITDFLFEREISADYNKPMTKSEIYRMGEERERVVYNNIKATHNLVSVCNAHAEDFGIVDTDKFDYILTYSFPCQDLSLAGKTQGMKKGSGTRSGLLWEVERILHELKEQNALPRVLLMENVTQVHGEKNWADFEAWKKSLHELGYSNFWQDLIATDYGIPQTRDRTFMVSILGDYDYQFPKPIKLEKRLKDLLEDKVDEKYYLSDKMIDFFQYNQKLQKELGNGFKWNVSDGNVIAKTITTRAGSRMDDNFIDTTNKRLKETINQNKEKLQDGCMIDTYNKSINKDVSGTITTRVNESNNTYLCIKNATKKGYLEAEEGDGVDISGRMEYHRGTVQKGATQTLTTNGGEHRGCSKGNYP